MGGIALERARNRFGVADRRAQCDGLSKKNTKADELAGQFKSRRPNSK
jgi:hypothetical protein